MVSIAFLLGARHLGEIVENKPASSLVVSLSKALNGSPPFMWNKNLGPIKIFGSGTKGTPWTPCQRTWSCESNWRQFLLSAIIFGCCIGPAPVTFIIAPDLMDQASRPAAMALGTLVGWIALAIVGFVTPYMFVSIAENLLRLLGVACNQSELQ